MSGGPRGTSPPLDLAAIEMRVGSRYANISNSTEALLESLDDAAALLALLRETRAALQPFAAWYDSGEEDDDARPVTLDSGKATIYYRGHHGQPVLTLGDLKRAAAVLAAAQDGPRVTAVAAIPPALCGQPVAFHVRDRQRHVGWIVCEQHVSWGEQQVARLGYQPVKIPAKQGTPAQREWISGCQAPRHERRGGAPQP